MIRFNIVIQKVIRRGTFRSVKLAYYSQRSHVGAK
jgi:hypothetical protein